MYYTSRTIVNPLFGRFLGKCLLYSLRLQVTGWVSGAVAGVLTGVAIGFSKGARYWIYPLVRVLGPIPSTACIPLAMISFSTVVSASAFLIALAVWFPTKVLQLHSLRAGRL